MKENAQKEQKSAESIGYRVFSAIRSVFIYLLALTIIAAAALFAANKSPDKSLFGYRYYTVLTDSMVPEFRNGDMVFVKITGAGQIASGDIITFNPSSDGDAYLTHRVVEVLPDYQGTGITCFRTKGDANNTEDSFLIDEARVIGKVKFHVPKLGFILRFVQLRWYFIVPLAGLLVLFFALMKRYFELREENEEADAPGGEQAPSEDGAEKEESNQTEEIQEQEGYHE